MADNNNNTGELEWSAVYDADGSIYYHNSRTDETSWDAPDTYNPPEGEPPAKASAAEKESGGTEGTWEKHVDEATGDIYYFNPTTEVTTWDKPAGYVEETQGDGDDKEADVKPEEEEDTKKTEEEEEALPSSPISGADGGDDQEENEEPALPKSPIGGSAEDGDGDDDEPPLPGSPIGGGGGSNDSPTTLGKGFWEKHNTDDGQVYYHNTKTDETTWDTPEGYQEGAAAPDDGGGDDDGEENADANNNNDKDVKMEDVDVKKEEEPTAEEPKDEKKGGAWEELQDEEGNVYYYNSLTEVTQWDKPDDFDAAAPTAAAADDEKKSPKAEAAAIADSGDATNSAANNTSSSGGWEKLEDEEGNVYYYNSQTEVTQWDKPDDFDESAAVQDDDASSSLPRPAADTGGDDADVGKWEKYTDDEGRTYYYNAATEETQWDAPEGFVDDGDGDEKKDDEGDEFQPSPTRSPSPASMSEDEKEKEEEKSTKEPEPEPEPEIDPAVKRVMDAEEALGKPDSVLEPGCTSNVLEVVASQDGNPQKAIMALIDNFQGQTAICGTLAKWLADLRSASSNNSDVNEVVGTARQSVADEIRDTAQDVVSQIAKERFSKAGGDNILNLDKAEAAFLQDMINSNRWRKLLIDLSATNKDSALLMYCIRTISKRGYHRELVKRMNPSEYFSVFNAMLQSELAVVGKASISASSDVDTSIGLEELVNDLRRTCTATAFTYLYSIEILRHLVSVAEQEAEDHPGRDPSRFRRAIRKWERLSQDLDSAMVDPNTLAATAGSSALFRKRRLDVALTISELHQRQRRRMKPSPDEDVILISTEDKQKKDMETGLLSFLRRYSVGTLIDDRVLEPLIPTGLNMQAAADEVGELLIAYPLAVRALISCIFKTGSSTRIPASTKSKCARLVALAVLAGDKKARAEIGERSIGGSAEKESPDEVALTRMLMQSAQLCEEVVLMAAFVVTSDGDHKGLVSPGQQLCNLALKSAPVAQGVMFWAREVTKGNEFTSTATYPTFSPSILSLVRIVALEHPCTRTDAAEIAFTFLRHTTSSEISYKKINEIKEQSLRLLLFLLVHGEAPSVLRTMVTRLQQTDTIKLDASLLRYFIGGVLEIVQAPFSLPFVRLFGALLKTPRCIEAVRSAYFGDENHLQLRKLLKSFKESCALKDDIATKNDLVLVAFLSKTYATQAG